ncbi:hypothetical protein ABZV80_33345 [Streptomyces sp. NPDC005132]|uniref:hypothetical protein n=1 Tax=Streptomyces sp. NPDC005132 TaxID=3154294 RepID=UPI0033BBF1C1
MLSLLGGQASEVPGGVLQEGNEVFAAPAPGGYATVRFLTTHQAGRLVAVTGLPSVTTTIPAVRVRAEEGTDVGPATSNRGRLGHVIVTGHDPHAVDEQADRILRQITVTVAPGSRT